ncbi:MAG: 2OG-Fe(II) oxygenase [Azospirillum sp.]|nr:2OG-Fe(II) oxygenase [Azospirillum sp.]
MGAQFIRCLDAGREEGTPYRHWLLDDALPDEAADAIAALPLAPPVVLETYGKRETHNASRSYFNAEQQARYPVCRAVAEALQSAAVVATIESRCGTRLAGTSLRIEYCQDTDGFWLEPHTDIGVKKFTMLIYLSQDPGSEAWGTDIYDAERTHVGTAPFHYKGGLIFVPGPDTWHGFAKRPIAGVRKSIIVNYVGSEWRARHELSFPETPVS